MAELLLLKDAGVWGDEDEKGGTLVLRSTNVRNDGSIDFDKQARRAIPAKKIVEKSLAEGDVLLERSGGSPAQPVGRVAYFGGYPQTIVHGNFMGRLRPNPDLVDPRYLFRYLHRFYQLGGTLRYQSQTTGLRNLKFKEYVQLEVPLPPRDEQRRIADLLDEADRLQRLRREANEKTRRILPALFIEMFGDPETNPMGWDESPLGAVLEDIDSGWSPRCEDRAATDREWAVLKLGAVSFGRFDQAQHKAMLPGVTPRPDIEVTAGDVLFSRKNTRQLVGATVFVPTVRGQLMFPDLMFRLRGNNAVTQQYLASVLSMSAIRERVRTQASGSAASMVNVSQGRLRRVVIPVPPKSLQQRFSAAYDRLNTLGDLCTAADAGLVAVAHRLRHSLFSEA